MIESVNQSTVTPTYESIKFKYVIQQADNCLILGQRLSEWCGHGPVLEQDIAMTNIALDLIGQARMLYQCAAEIQGEGKSEDDLVAFRDVWDFRNVLLVEQLNGDFAQTIFRQFLFDSYSVYFWEELSNSNDKQLAAIGAKSYKEALYHLRWSGDWVIRLGDGTEESKKRMVKAITELWSYSAELVMPNEVDNLACKEGYGVNLKALASKRFKRITEVLEEATLDVPSLDFAHQGGKEGRHTEQLGYILAELQFLQRAYPDNEW